jgi:hypothetical protein
MERNARSTLSTWVRWFVSGLVFGIVMLSAVTATAVVRLERSDDRESARAAAQAWFDAEGREVVRQVLLVDREWAADLGLTGDSYLAAEGFRRHVALNAPDFDLKTGRAQGSLRLDDYVFEALSFCSRLVVDDVTVNTDVCVEVDGSLVEFTSVGEVGYVVDISEYPLDVDFVDNFSWGVYARVAGRLIPVTDIARHYVPHPIYEEEFMEAAARRSAEYQAIVRAKGTAFGGTPALLDPDPEELAAWEALVAESLAATEADNRNLVLLWSLLGGGVLIAAAATLTWRRRREAVR